MEAIEAVGILIGIVTGVAGLVLGIVNAIQQRSTVQPRLRVEPSIQHIISRGIPGSPNNIERNIGIMTVYNIGNVPVMGASIGFDLKRAERKSLIVITPHSLSGEPWPAEILPGRSISLRMETDKLREYHGSNQLGRAYVRTAIGDIFSASKKTMDKFEAQLDDGDDAQPDD